MYRIYENEEERGLTSMLLERDQILTVKSPHTIEDAIKAIADINNYGEYTSSIRSTKVTDRDLEAHFGPRSIRAKTSLERERGEPFPIKTPQAIQDFIKSKTTKPDLLYYIRKGDTLVFPVENNPNRGRVKNLIKTVMTNAGIKYELSNTAEAAPKRKLKKVVQEILKKKL